MKYQAKPNIVDAFYVDRPYYTESKDEREAYWPDWLLQGYKARDVDCFPSGRIRLSEDMAEEGDWIIRDSRGKLIGMRSDEFEFTYRAITDG